MDSVQTQVRSGVNARAATANLYLGSVCGQGLSQIQSQIQRFWLYQSRLGAYHEPIKYHVQSTSLSYKTWHFSREVTKDSCSPLPPRKTHRTSERPSLPHHRVLQNSCLRLIVDQLSTEQSCVPDPDILSFSRGIEQWLRKVPRKLPRR